MSIGRFARRLSAIAAIAKVIGAGEGVGTTVPLDV
jgi:hypothetical protein